MSCWPCIMPVDGKWGVRDFMCSRESFGEMIIFAAVKCKK